MLPLIKLTATAPPTTPFNTAIPDKINSFATKPKIKAHTAPQPKPSGANIGAINFEIVSRMLT